MAPNSKYFFHGQRFDAATTLFLARELEAVDQYDYSELNAGSLAMKYFPLVTGVGQWDASYTYKMYKAVGRAKVSSRNNDDAPAVSLVMTPATKTIKDITDSYKWSFADIQRAAQAGVPLDRMTAMAARMASDRKIDDLLALGDTTIGIEGFLKLTDVSPLTAVAKTSGTTWNTNKATDADKIIADVSSMTAAVFQALKQTTDAPQFQKFVLLVPTLAYTAIATTARSANSDTTILRFILNNNPWIEAIEPWFQCDTAGAGSVGRAMLYPRNPLWGGALCPMDFYSLPPQENGQDIVVPTRSSCGGAVVRYPVGTAYMDGV